MQPDFKLIKPLLNTGSGKTSRFFSYAGLSIGVLIFLCALQMFINMQQLMKEGSIKKDGFDYISITKTITNQTMGQPEKHLFAAAEINEIRQQPFITGVSPLISNDFRVKLSAGNVLPFSTDMFLEALDDEFLDTLPPEFKWQPGDANLPIILSSDFFEIYNIFAPGQNLPQVSKETATGIPVQVHCEGRFEELQYASKIVAFSDRVNSVLVPKSFLVWANKKLGTDNEETAARLFLKLKDVNNPDFVKFVEQKGYNINKERTLLGRNKVVIQGIITGLGIFGTLVVMLALLLFSFFLQVLVARSEESLRILLILGYQPKWLARNVTLFFVPVYIGVVLVALAATQLIQWGFHKFIMFNRPEISSILHYSVWIAAVIISILPVVINYRMVKRLLLKLFLQNK